MKRNRRAVFFIALSLLTISQVILPVGCLKSKSSPPPVNQGSGTSGTGAAQQAVPPLTSGEKPGGSLQAGGGERSGLLSSQPSVTYGAYALWTGRWDTTFYKYGGKEHKAIWQLTQVESSVTGTYDWQSGRTTLRQSKTSGLAIGTWAEAPTYKPPEDAGDIEIQQSTDGNSFMGKWRYGSSGDWVGEWNGRRIR